MDMKLYRVRRGYYETNLGHSIERFSPLQGNPLTWVIRYPGDITGDVSRDTLREAWAYLQQNLENS